MLDDLLKFYISEGVDKQVLKKIPYFLMVSLLIYLVLVETGAKVDIGPSFIIIPAICAILFIVSNAYFLRLVNSSLAGAFKDLDFKKLVGKFSSVYEGGASLLDDINLRKGVPIADFRNLKWTFAIGTHDQRPPCPDCILRYQRHCSCRSCGIRFDIHSN